MTPNHALLPMTAALGVIGEGGVVGAAFMAELFVLRLGFSTRD